MMVRCLHNTIIPDALILYSGKRPSYFAQASLILSNPLPHASIIPLYKTVDLVYTKYLKALIYYEGIQRIEQFMFPQEACYKRQALPP